MSERRSGLAVGMTVFAGTIMIMIGVMHVFQGIVALVNDTFYVAGEEWVLQLDVTSWGWVHLILGAVVVLAGFFVFRGAVWARTVGVIMAVLSGLASFAWLPYYPVWALVVIALDVFVIWSLTVHGREIAEPV
ncbi:hypothetical protein FA014_05140 [Cellulomonas hominis]|uniref:DUF7144 domain-containing protein n=1 Tax=Cellulomonas hominis TaxID=156981 RepID=A0A7Z8K1P2_9CELL|nr:hypothetical protein [Cellulomonas hominis]TKR26545.1 hypothetical protein FA014_05140 [Cellulomonas hominis]